jgi:hypothetical protein
MKLVSTYPCCARLVLASIDGIQCSPDRGCRRSTENGREAALLVRASICAICLAAAVLLLAGCAQEFVRKPGPPSQPAPPPRPAPPPINLSGYSAAFKEGFQAGCDTARGVARRDEQRMQSDPQYAQGWQDGRSICAKR